MCVCVPMRVRVWAQLCIPFGSVAVFKRRTEAASDNGVYPKPSNLMVGRGGAQLRG